MFYSISLAVGLCLLIASLIIFRKSVAFIRQNERATGQVVELERVQDNDGVTWKPVFRFRTLQNEEVVYRHFASSSPPGWKVGEEAQFAYPVGDPSKAKLLTYFGAFSWTIVLMAISMPLIVIGGGYYVAQGFLK